jgi:hypothetical protein
MGKKIFNSKSKIIIEKRNKKKLHEAKYLSLNSRKSLKALKWKIYMSPKLSLKLTFDWFKVFYSNKKNKKKVIDYTIKQFESFQNIIKYF